MTSLLLILILALSPLWLLAGERDYGTYKVPIDDAKIANTCKSYVKFARKAGGNLLNYNAAVIGLSHAEEKIKQLSAGSCSTNVPASAVGSNFMGVVVGTLNGEIPTGVDPLIYFAGQKSPEVRIEILQQVQGGEAPKTPGPGSTFMTDSHIGAIAQEAIKQNTKKYLSPVVSRIIPLGPQAPSSIPNMLISARLAGVTAFTEVMIMPPNLKSHHPCDTISCQYARNLHNFLRPSDLIRAKNEETAPMEKTSLYNDCRRSMEDYYVGQYIKSKMAKDSTWEKVQDFLFPLRNRNMDGTLGAIIDGVQVSPEDFTKEIDRINTVMDSLK